MGGHMAGGKRKICHTSPEDLSHQATDSNNRTPKIYKIHSVISILAADLQKIKSIIESYLLVELLKSISNLATKEDLNKLNTEINTLRQQNEVLSQKVQQFE